MKNRILNSVIVGTLSVFMVTSVCAQTKNTAKAKTHTKAIEKTKVPKVVTDEFSRECPIVESYIWYGYPNLGNESEWFDYNPINYTCENPEYYEVEFVKEKAHHKAVYSKDGKKVATHHKVKKELLPPAVNKALESGAYKGWKEVGEKEEIEKSTTKEKIFKITVEKNGNKHHLFYDETGKLLKDEAVIIK